MAIIALISCGKDKLSFAAKARYLYTGDLFTKTLKYTETILKPYKIFILSAKHGLLKLDKEIEPYDETLKDKRRDEQKEWANNVLHQLGKECDVKNDNFIILAGADYYQDLIKHLPNVDIHFKKLKFGQRLQFLKRKLNGQLL